MLCSSEYQRSLYSAFNEHLWRKQQFFQRHYFQQTDYFTFASKLHFKKLNQWNKSVYGSAAESGKIFNRYLEKFLLAVSPLHSSQHLSLPETSQRQGDHWQTHFAMEWSRRIITLTIVLSFYLLFTRVVVFCAGR